jgi:hypothetical protein
METISAVKFATLHNNKTIFYSHINCIDQVFDKIKCLDHEVILITGSGDISVSTFNAPENVKYWFAQNSLVQHEKIIPIPIGIRDSFPHYFGDQCPIVSGAEFLSGQIADRMLTEIYLNDNSNPDKFLYSNFNCNTNIPYRSFLRDVCEHIDFISYELPNESEGGYQNYYSKILGHQASLCPIGNGIDTHRIWETLYCKRIPITINCNYKYQNKNIIPIGSSYIFPQENEYSIYTKLYSQLPIIILNSYEELFDKQYMRELIDNKRRQEYNSNLLDFNYWRDLILNLSNSLESK